MQRFIGGTSKLPLMQTTQSSRETTAATSAGGITLRTTMGLKLRRQLAFVTLGLACLPMTGLATELGSSNFPLGAQTVAVALLPPPGSTAFFGYFLYYHADSFRDNHGNSAIPDFDADIFAIAARVVHTWGSFKGLTLGVAAVLEPVSLKVDAAGANDEMTGMNLIGLEPFNMNWSTGNWHFMTGTLCYLPLGDYERGALANSSTHYANVTQQAGITWLTSRWDISLNPNLSFNFRNRATDYRSGTLFGLTGGMSYRLFETDPRWQVGANGYYAKQLSDDRLHGDKVPGGFRLQKYSLGPQLTFWPSPTVALLLKWQHEFAVNNGPEGDLLWFEFVLPL